MVNRQGRAADVGRDWLGWAILAGGMILYAALGTALVAFMVAR